jgi:hypothetical protein
MAAEDCIAFIREQAPDLSDDEIEQIVSDLQSRMRAREARGEAASLDQALLNEADELARETAAAAQVERRNRALKIMAERDVLDTAQRANEAVGDPSLGLEAAMVGVNAPFAGARRSVDASAGAIFAEYGGGLIADLRRAGLLTRFNSRDLEPQIARELSELNKRNGNPGASGSTAARRIAEIVQKYQRASLQRQNRAGAWIRPLDGFIASQTHDMGRLRRASARLGQSTSRDPDVNYQAWRNFVLPLLDERTFDDVDDAEAFLRGVYDALSSGVHLKHDGADIDLQFAFKGPRNLAKKASSHRKLHFKDSDAWLTYNEQFGTRGLTDAIVQDLERSSRNIALMERFGPNPGDSFQRVRDQLMEEHRQDPRKVDRLRRRGLDSQLAEVDGTASIPLDPTMAHVGQGVRALQTLSKLGGAALSAISDIAFHASEVRFQGRSVLGGYGQALRNILDGMPTDADRRNAAELIGVGLEGQLGDIAARFTAQDHTPGRISKLQQMFFKLNLLGPWTDANKRGVGLMMARDMAMNSDRGWDALPERIRGVLEAYGMDARRWDVARQAVQTAEDGRAYLMPHLVRDLPDEAVGATGRAARRERDEIETALRSYYVDRADFAAPTPGARERAMLRQGLQPGTFMGELMRFVTQFKAFPITALTKPVGREVFGGGARTMRDAFLKGQGDMLGLASMIAGTTILGYLAMTSKDISKGRTPRDPTSPDTWIAAASQGGGLGIYGDFLFGEFNRFGRSLPGTLAGPTIGQTGDLLEIFHATIAGEDALPRGLNFVTSNTPFLNLFYTRAALDYLIFYQLQEAVNPGYLRRMERRVQRENQQTFILPPSRAIPRGGGDDVLEGVR